VPYELAWVLSFLSCRNLFSENELLKQRIDEILDDESKEEEAMIIGQLLDDYNVKPLD
jgi:hypothetical protein